MTTKTVLYFTAGKVPTTGELADIAALNAISGLNVGVRNGSSSVNQEYGTNLEACDYVAGTVPTAYNGVTAYGAIPGIASAPLKLKLVTDNSSSTTFSHTTTKQLRAIAMTGTNINDLSAADVTATNMAYASSDTNKATVNASSGLVTGVAAGSVTITATYTYSSGKTTTATLALTLS